MAQVPQLLALPATQLTQFGTLQIKHNPLLGRLLKGGKQAVHPVLGATAQALQGEEHIVQTPLDIVYPVAQAPQKLLAEQVKQLATLQVKQLA